VIVFCTIRGFNDYTQVIFWRTGIIAYLSNVLLFILILLYILNRFLLSTKRVRPWEYGVMLVAFLIAGGICETWIVMQVSLFAIGILVALLFRKKLPHDDLLKMLVVGFIASCLAFLITIMAPGNSNHSSTMEDLSLQRIIKYLFVSFADVPWFLVEWVNRRTILAGLITITGFIAGLYGKRQSDLDGRIYLQFGGIMLVCACLMLWMGLFPGYTVFGVPPPDRAIFTAMFIFLMAYALFCFLIGWIVGSLLPSSFQNPVYVLLAFCLAVLVYLSPIQTAISQLKLIPILQLYAHLWDERDAFLRRAGEQGQGDVTIPSIRYHPDLGALKSTIWLVGELEEDPGNWKNNAASIYYGLHSITGQVNPPSYEFK
jgi:hypothetical protein